MLGDRGRTLEPPRRCGIKERPQRGQKGWEKMDYGNTYHRDGTVTYWDVYRQAWTRVAAEKISDESLATMGQPARDRIERHIMITGNQY